MNCSRAKSDTTPCYLRDVDTVVVEIRGGPCCVGCEWWIRRIKEIEKARLLDHVITSHFYVKDGGHYFNYQEDCSLEEVLEGEWLELMRRLYP